MPGTEPTDTNQHNIERALEKLFLELMDAFPHIGRNKICQAFVFFAENLYPHTDSFVGMHEFTCIVVEEADQRIRADHAWMVEPGPLRDEPGDMEETLAEVEQLDTIQDGMADTLGRLLHHEGHEAGQVAKAVVRTMARMGQINYVVLERECYADKAAYCASQIAGPQAEGSKTGEEAIAIGTECDNSDEKRGDWLERKLEQLFREMEGTFPEAGPQEICDAFLEAGSGIYATDPICKAARLVEYHYMVFEVAGRVLEASGITPGALDDMEDAEDVSLSTEEIEMFEEMAARRRNIRARTRRPIWGLQRLGYTDGEIARALVVIGLDMAPLWHVEAARGDAWNTHLDFQSERDAMLAVTEPPGTDPEVADAQVERGPPPGAKFSDYFDPSALKPLEDGARDLCRDILAKYSRSWPDGGYEALDALINAAEHVFIGEQLDRRDGFKREIKEKVSKRVSRAVRDHGIEACVASIIELGHPGIGIMHPKEKGPMWLEAEERAMEFIDQGYDARDAGRALAAAALDEAPLNYVHQRTPFCFGDKYPLDERIRAKLEDAVVEQSLR
jgi:hypothetical protein